MKEFLYRLRTGLRYIFFPTKGVDAPTLLSIMQQQVLKCGDCWANMSDEEADRLVTLTHGGYKKFPTDPCGSKQCCQAAGTWKWYKDPVKRLPGI